MKRFVVLLFLLQQGCAHDSGYKQVAGETPHYGLSTITTPDGDVCKIYNEENNGVAIWCRPKQK